MVVFLSEKHQVLWEERGIRGTTATNKIPPQYRQFNFFCKLGMSLVLSTNYCWDKKLEIFFLVFLNQPKLYREKNLLSTSSIMLHTVNCQTLNVMLKMFYICSVPPLIFVIVKKKGQVRQLKVTLTPHTCAHAHPQNRKEKTIFSIINSEFYETAATLFWILCFSLLSLHALSNQKD